MHTKLNKHFQNTNRVAAWRGSRLFKKTGEDILENSPLSNRVWLVVVTTLSHLQNP